MTQETMLLCSGLVAVIGMCRGILLVLCSGNGSSRACDFDLRGSGYRQYLGGSNQSSFYFRRI